MLKHYSGLWFLLALALVIFITIAFTDDVSFGDYTVKKASFADVLLGEGDLENDTAMMDVMPDTIATEEPLRTDSMPQSLFIFGDSMTYNLALRLAQYAKANGHTIHAVNWDSSNTKIWADNDSLANFIERYRPTQIFISLGSNELYFKKPESRLKYIKRILEVIDTIPYVWIGPPNWKEDSGINDLLARVCRRGSFFRSEGMEFKRKADHIHPTRQSSFLWMDSIMRWLPNSSHPFLADVPGDSIGKVNPNIVFLKALNK